MPHWLIQKNARRSFIYLVAAVLFSVIAISGFEYGALPAYMLPALICAAQFAYPTPLGWGLVFIPVALAATLWAFALVRDLIWLALGKRPSVLLDLDDSVIFLVALFTTIAVTVVLYRVRPRRIAA